MSVRPLLFVLVLCVPTAHTSLAETTATPARMLKVGSTLGLATTRQLVPSQCRVSVRPRLVLLSWFPTAQISLAETTATPYRWSKVVPTLGLETTFQVLPFQCRMSV